MNYTNCFTDAAIFSDLHGIITWVCSRDNMVCSAKYLCTEMANEIGV